MYLLMAMIIPWIIMAGHAVLSRPGAAPPDSAAWPGLPGRAVSQSPAAASSSCFEVALQRNTFPVAIFSFSLLITISVMRRAQPAQSQSAHDLNLDSYRIMALGCFTAAAMRTNVSSFYHLFLIYQFCFKLFALDSHGHISQHDIICRAMVREVL